MRTKIIFSGVMGAILMMSGASAEIASRAYVDAELANAADNYDLRGSAAEVQGNLIGFQNREEGFATSAQGAAAELAVQPGDNVSGLTNDAGYLTATTIGDLGLATSQSVSEVNAALQNLGTAAQADVEDFDAAGTAAAAVAEKANLQADAVAGNVAVMAEGGQYVDSNMALDDLVSRAEAQGSFASKATEGLADNLLRNMNEVRTQVGGGTLSTVATSLIPAVNEVVADLAGIDASIDGKQDRIGAGTNGAVLTYTGTEGVVGSMTLGVLATAAPGACSNPTSKCLLTFDGTNFGWEVIARDTLGN